LPSEDSEVATTALPVSSNVNEMRSRLLSWVPLVLATALIGCPADDRQVLPGEANAAHDVPAPDEGDLRVTRDTQRVDLPLPASDAP